MDLELIGGLGNLAFDKEQTSALSDPANAGAFSPQTFPLLLARLSVDHRGLAYSGGFERDPLMRNRLFANIKAELDCFFIEAGPFIGLFNSSKLPVNPGISAALGLGIPGIVFARAKGSSTLGTVMEIKGNYSQNTGDISAGFWVPHVICSLNMSVRNFTIREKANLLVEDELARYFFSADVYTKNIPYTIRVDLGFQNLKRSYTSQDVTGGNLARDTQGDEYKSVFVGLEASYTTSPALKFLLGGEMPVYSWGARPMKDPPMGTMLFQVRAGVVWTLPSSSQDS
jgi:hypothetical protein